MCVCVCRGRDIGHGHMYKINLAHIECAELWEALPRVCRPHNDELVFTVFTMHHDPAEGLL